MDASCKVQGSIHEFNLIHNVCPEFWVHINSDSPLKFNYYARVCEKISVN